MCMLCVEYEKGKLTWQEAFNNLRESFNEEDPHSLEIWEKLIIDEMKRLNVNDHGNGD